MSSKKKLTETPEVGLRRSTRATRGSLKPVVDLVKQEQEVVEKETQPETNRESKSKAKKQPIKKEVVEVKDEISSDEDVVIADKQVGKEDEVVLDDDDEAEEELDDNDDEDDEDFEEPKSKRTSSRAKTTGTAKKTPKANVKKQPSKEAKTTKGKQTKKEPNKDELEDVEIYYDLNEKEMKEVNNAFDMNCSQDGEESMNSDDLKTAIRSLGFEPRVDEINKLIEKFGTPNGKVNRHSFHKIMAFKMGSTPGINDNILNDEISRVFNLLDLDKTGMITVENLRSISRELNEELTDEELNEMIAEADLDGDFMINKQEFYNIMKKTSLY